MKKFIAITLTAAMLASFTACGDGSGGSSESANEIVTELMAFRSAKIGMGDDFEEILCTDKRISTYLIFGTLPSGEQCGYITDGKFTEKRSFTFTPEDGETVRTAALMSLGKAAVLSTLDGSTFITVFDKESNQTARYDIGELIGEDDHYVQLVCSDDGFYVNLFRHTLCYIDSDGNYVGSVKTKGSNISAICNDIDGKPVVLSTESIETFIGTLVEGKVEDEVSCGELATDVYCLGAGMGDFRVCAILDRGVFALRDNKWVMLNDLSETDFFYHNVFGLDMTAEGEFAAFMRLDSGEFQLRLLSERDISEIKQKKIIRLAEITQGDQNKLDEKMKKFNLENDEYKLEIASYSNIKTTAENHFEPYKKLRLDILSGNAPDIIRFSEEMPIESFGSSSGIFVDLYDMIDNDPDISRDDFLDGFLEGMERGGKLCSIQSTFNVSGYFMKEKNASAFTTFDYDALENLCKSCPEDTKLIYDQDRTYRYYPFTDLFSICEYMDYDTHTCDFDSPDFIRALNMVNDYKLGLTADEYDAIWATADPTLDSDIEGLRNDKLIMSEAWRLSYFRDFKIYEQVYCGEPMRFLGRPSRNDNSIYANTFGYFGIMSTSENVQGAWDFLKYYLFVDDGSHYDYEFGFSGLKEKYNEQLQEACTYHSYTDPETGEEKNADRYTYFVGGNGEEITFELEPFDDEKAAYYDNLMKTALLSPNRRVHDDNVTKILWDELDPFFNGERSAEDTAKLIQDRVSIYLSEIS